MFEVPLSAVDPQKLGAVVPTRRIEALIGEGQDLLTRLSGASVVSVNSTAAGGGVAEMLQSLLPYARGAGVDARWLVIEADEKFFEITKRIHNQLHGGAGDGGPLGPDEHAHYAMVLARNWREIRASVASADVVILHDPQTAGLARPLSRMGVRVVWRSHVGVEERNRHTDVAWGFLRRYVDPSHVDAYVFTRRTFAPGWVPSPQLYEIPPSIDPFSAKNQELSDEQVDEILCGMGLLSGLGAAPGARSILPPTAEPAELICHGRATAAEAPYVVQVSRWDRLKDMIGVMHGFAQFAEHRDGIQLILAGPAVTSVADDPEGVTVLAECRAAWEELPPRIRSRVALACLPMADRVQNALAVNALQRRATIVVQKSLAEGFGLTVSEAMYKRRPVVGSAVGGIMSQLVHGETGYLVQNPHDPQELTETLATAFARAAELPSLGERGHRRVLDGFLPDVQLRRWATLIRELAA